MRINVFLLRSLILLVAFCASVHGGTTYTTVQWNTPADLGDSGDLQIDGTVLGALHAAGNFGETLVAGSLFDRKLMLAEAVDGRLNGLATGDAQLDQLLDAGNTGTGLYVIELASGALTPGEPYLVQLILSDLQELTDLEISDGLGNSIVLDSQGSQPGITSFGQVVSGSFVAADTSLWLELSNPGAGDIKLTAAQVTGAFRDDMESIKPPLAVSGSFPFVTRINLESVYPRRTNPGDPARAGDLVDQFSAAFFDLAGYTTDAVLEVPAIDAGLIDAAGAAVILDQVYSAALDESLPGFAAREAAVASDLAAYFYNPSFGGDLSLALGPDVSGVVPNATHSYRLLSADWNLPCVDDPNCTDDSVSPLLRVLTEDPTLTIQGQFDGPVDNAALQVPNHALVIPLGKIFVAFAENFALPELFGNPAIDSLDRVVYELNAEMLIDYYNGTPAGLASPIACGPCSCADGGLALELLFVDAGGNAADAALLKQHACAGASSLADDWVAAVEDGLTVTAGQWQFSGACPFIDFNDDLIADDLGPQCQWASQFQFQTGDIVNASAISVSSN